MCNPAALAIGQMAVAMAATYSQQKGLAEQAESQQNLLYDHAMDENEALAAQRNEQSQEGAQEASEVSKQARRERSMMRVAAGESGLVGPTSDRLMTESFVDQGERMAGINVQQKRMGDQNKRQGKAASKRYQSGVNSIQRPNSTAAGLRIVGAGLDAAQSYRTMNKKA